MDVERLKGIENGTISPGLDELLLLANELEVHPYVLLYPDEIPEDKLEAMNQVAHTILGKPQKKASEDPFRDTPEA
jgi:hypothetical protein